MANPKYGKIFVLSIFFLMLLVSVAGVFGYFFSSNESVREVSIGLIVMGMGLIGFAKAAIEVFENHRTDKQSSSSSKLP